MARKSGGLVALLVVLAFGAFVLNCGTSNSRPAGVLFVTSQGASTVQSYAINLGNGGLSQLNTSASTCSSSAQCGFPLNIILDPARANAFVLNQGVPTLSPPAPPSIYGYGVNSNGSLTSAGDLTTKLNAFTAGDAAVAMTRDAAGKFLFVVTQGNQTLPTPLAPQLVVFSIQSGSTNLTLTGQTALTRIPTAVGVITFTVPNSNPAVQQTLLYITSSVELPPPGITDNVVSEYAVDASGAATQEPGSPYTTGTIPSAVLPVLTPSNNLFVYVANGNTDNNIRIFQVCTVVNANCAEADVGKAVMVPVGSPVAAGLSPVGMITDLTSNFLYVVNSGSNTVSAFRINPGTGALTALTPPTVSTGTTPVAMALHPNGQFLYVSNSAASTVSSFSVNTTSGALSGGGTTSSSAQPAGLAAK